MLLQDGTYRLTHTPWGGASCQSQPPRSVCRGSLIPRNPRLAILQPMVKRTPSENNSRPSRQQERRAAHVKHERRLLCRLRPGLVTVPLLAAVFAVRTVYKRLHPPPDSGSEHRSISASQDENIADWVRLHHSYSRASVLVPHTRARHAIRWLLHHPTVAFAILLTPLYVSIWLSYLAFYYDFGLSPSDAGLIGFQGVAALGIGIVIVMLLGSALGVGVQLLGAVLTSFHRNALRRAITAGAASQDPHQYLLAQLSVRLPLRWIHPLDVTDVTARVSSQDIRRGIGGFDGTETAGILTTKNQLRFPLDPPTLAAFDLVVAGRLEGPLFVDEAGQRLSRSGLKARRYHLRQTSWWWRPTSLQPTVWRDLLPTYVAVVSLLALGLISLLPIESALAEQNLWWRGNLPSAGINGLSPTLIGLRANYARVQLITNGSTDTPSLAGRPCLLALSQGSGTTFLYDLEARQLIRVPPAAGVLIERTSRPSDCLVGHRILIVWQSGNPPPWLTAQSRACFLYVAKAGATTTVRYPLSQHSYDFPSASATVVPADTITKCLRR
jgi:hypothetical protein